MDLELNEEQKIIQTTAREFARAELEPVAARLDQTEDRETFLKNIRKLADLGFMGLNIREEYGGSHAGMVAFSAAITELARACASTAVTVSVTNLVANVIQAAGSEAQKQTYLPEIMLRGISRRQLCPVGTGGRFRSGLHDHNGERRMEVDGY